MPLSVVEVAMVVVKVDRRKDRVAIGIVTMSLDDVLLRTFASRHFLTPRWHVVYVPPHYLSLLSTAQVCRRWMVPSIIVQTRNKILFYIFSVYRTNYVQIVEHSNKKFLKRTIL